MKKRLVSSTLLTMCMALVLALLPVSASEAESWEPYGPGAPAGGKKYTITYAEQLQALAAAVNEGQSYMNTEFKLTGDIDLSSVCGASIDGEEVSWTPIGGYNNRIIGFSGTFDGCNYKIKNLYINSADEHQGLFGSLNRLGTVKNLGVSGKVTGGRIVGGVVGYNYNGLVENCYNEGSVSGPYIVGGVVGYNTHYESLNDGLVKNCYNTGSVTGTGTGNDNVYAGGVVGWNDITVEECYNTGSVTGSGAGRDKRVEAGGVVGSNGGTVKDCYSTDTSSVSGAGNDAFANYVEVGGVAGDNIAGTMTGCYNDGSVTHINSDGFGHFGGVVGYIHSGSVTGCHNTGAVTGHGYAGGVAGDVQGGLVENCYNEGSVTGTGNAGGVVGSTGGTVENCYNTGSVTGTSDAGGVVGYNTSTGAVTDCYNTGSVSGSSTGGFAYVGGVVGRSYGAVENCYNTGSVTGSVSAAQIGSTYVFGSAYVGGAVGANRDGTVKNCYNTGSVSGFATDGYATAYAGGVVGDNHNTVENCYYLKTEEINSALEGIGKSTGSSIVEKAVVSKNKDAFASGEVAWLLQNGQDTQEPLVWGQTLPTDGFPLLAASKIGKAALKVYQVTFDYDYAGAEQKVTYTNPKLDTPDNPTREGYIFDGWFKDPARTTEWNFETDTVSGDITLYAKWTADTSSTPTSYTVTFDSQGGSAVTVQTVTNGGKVTKPDDPSRTGFIFGGWFKDDAYTTAWNFETDTVSGDITLYAKWTTDTSSTPVSYTVTFDSQGGSTVTVQAVEDGGKVTKPDDPSRTGFIFGGWFKDDACTTEWNFETDTVTGNITLYAKWTADTSSTPTSYTVTFDSQGGSTVTAQAVEDGGKVTKPDDPSRTGFIFGGWYKDGACTTEWNFETDTVTGNITLYAKWTADTSSTPTSYTVTFDSQGGSMVTAQAVEDGGKVTKPDDPTRTGFIFGGWFKDDAYTTEWNFETDTVTGNITLYAKWTADTSSAPVLYTVTFDSQGGSAVTVQTVTNGGKVTKPDDPTWIGYTFGGWFKDDACITAWNFDSDTVTGNITLYAKWTADTSSTPTSYTVTFDSQGGSTVTAQTVTNGGKVTKPTDPIRTGFTFGGWFKDDVYTTAWNFETDTVTGAITLYAKWIAGTSDTYAIRIDPWIWDGEVYTSHTYAEPGTLVTIMVYPDTDYIVDWVDVERDDTGRYLALSQSGRRYTFTMPASDVTVYAGFSLEIDTYEVWITSGIQHGDVYTSHTFAEPGTKVTITVAPDSYYKLDWIQAEREDTGRSLSLSQSGSRYTFTMPYSDVVIDAGFSLQITYTESSPQTTYNSIRPVQAPTTTRTTTQTSTSTPAFTSAATASFSDVQPGSYCYDAVTWAVGNRITTGYGDGTFRPETSCTRADFVTFLWRAMGSPTPSSQTNPFVDVSPNAYYYDAMLWALEQGITAGSTDTTFSPDSTCTRAQIVTFLWRAHGQPSVNGGASFSDVLTGSYYGEAVAWAVAKGITVGTTATTFGSESLCTHGQCLTFLYRDIANYL